MDVKILGTGCANCQRLEAVAREAVGRLGGTSTFEKVTDPVDIAGWGVMRTPALVVDGVVRLSGRVPSVDDLEHMLRS